MSREDVGHMWLQETHMENRMDLNGRGESQTISRGSNLANDGEGSKSADVQFGCGSRCADVAPQQPYFLADDKGWGWSATPIG